VSTLAAVAGAVTPVALFSSSALAGAPDAALGSPGSGSGHAGSAAVPQIMGGEEALDPALATDDHHPTGPKLLRSRSVTDHVLDEAAHHQV
jgi:hypothetical protein